ncbi:MAG: hypothetical protein KAT00_10765 [Planctomycetes bacterium]|nr:hypothetical protein [Planctomycetota bacterium]
MKTIRAQVAGSHVVIMAGDESGTETPHVIAGDDSAAYAALCAVIESAAPDVPPRARVGTAPAVEAEIVESFDPREEIDDREEIDQEGTWIGDAAAFISDARSVIETDERAGAAWGSFLGVLRDLSAQKGDT